MKKWDDLYPDLEDQFGVTDYIIPSGQFVAGFKPPDYLVDGILQRRCLYSLTAPTGSGKTAIALLLAAHVARGSALAGHAVEQGRVVYFAGENPVDVCTRWIAMADQLGFNASKIDVHFVDRPLSLHDLFESIKREVTQLGGIDLVVIDSSVSYFDGDDENSNVQSGKHARMLRRLTELPGHPCVVVCCHPSKYAETKESMLPRGGGAFIAEIDGNLAATKRDGVVELHWTGKFRGQEFEPVSFRLTTVSSAKLKDQRSRLIPTIMAEPLTERGLGEMQNAARRDEDALLVLLAKAPGGSMARMAEALSWFYGKDKDKPHKMRVSRALDKLKTATLVEEVRGEWRLTPKGKKETKKVG